MNYIFICVFNKQSYIDLLYLLLESIYIYGKININNKILIYTSTPFMNKIKQSHLFSNYIIFEINDSYTCIDSACKSRLDVFELESVSKCDKVLYLDTDIIIKGNINKLFDNCSDDLIYVLEEGDITDSNDYYGKSLFMDEVNTYEDKTAFSSGIILFNNCDKVKELFIKIKEHICISSHTFYDQPYFVYNAFKYNLYNNKLLKEYAVSNDANIHSNKIIHHFCGGPGISTHKIVNMSIFLYNIKEFTISNNIEDAKQYINKNLLNIINDIGEPLEGNIFMKHHTVSFSDAFLNKTKNISNIVLNKNIKDVMEIGFNAGFSTLLMLLSNNDIHVTCFDLGEHKYTIPCYNKLKETFGDRISLILGDSTKTLKTHSDKYEVIHIDGGHTIEIAESDIKNSYRLSNEKTIIIMDDYDFPNLHTLWDKYIDTYNLKKLNIGVYDSPHHDIKYV